MEYTSLVPVRRDPFTHLPIYPFTKGKRMSQDCGNRSPDTHTLFYLSNKPLNNIWITYEVCDDGELVGREIGAGTEINMAQIPRIFHQIGKVHHEGGGVELGEPGQVNVFMDSPRLQHHHHLVPERERERERERDRTSVLVRARNTHSTAMHTTQITHSTHTPHTPHTQHTRRTHTAYNRRTQLLP